MKRIAATMIICLALAGCTSTGSAFSLDTALIEPAAVTFEKHFPDHDPQDSDRSFTMIHRIEEDGDHLFRGTTEFGEGFRTSSALPLDATHGVYVTLTVDGSILEGAGSSSPAFIDLFFTGIEESVLSPYGSLFLRYEQLRDTGSDGLVTFIYDGDGSFLSVPQQVPLQKLLGKRITFSVYYDSDESRWAYTATGDLTAQGYFDATVGVDAFPDGVFIALCGDRNAQSPDTVTIQEIGTITL